MINDETFNKTCAQLAEKFDEKKKELEHLKSESRSITLPSAIRNFASAGALATCGYFAYVGFQPIAPIIGIVADVVLFPPALICSIKCLKKISETINPDQIIEKVAVMELLNEIQGKQNGEEASKNILRKIAFQGLVPSKEEGYDQTEEEKKLEALINIGRGVGEKATSEEKKSLSEKSVFKEAKEFFNVTPLPSANLQEPDIEQGNSREEKQGNAPSGELKNPSSTSLNPNQNQPNQGR